MKPVMMCGLLAESLQKIENLRAASEKTALMPKAEPADGSSDEKKEIEPDEETVLMALEELHRYEELTEEIGNGKSLKEKSEMYFLCSAAVRILASEVYELTASLKDRTRAKRYNSEAMRTARKASEIADARGGQASEAVLFGLDVI